MPVKISDIRMPAIRKSGEVFIFLSKSLPPSEKMMSGMIMAKPRSKAKEIRSDFDKIPFFSSETDGF